MTDSSAKADDVVRQLARMPRLKDRAVQVVADLEARAAKATALEIMAVLIEHAPVYGLGNKSEGEYEALFVVYLRALAPLPIEAIREAFVMWGRDGTGFYPRPEQIFQRADPYAKNLWMAAYRAKRAAEYVERNPPAKSAEERAADRQKAIDMGLIDPETGKVILAMPSVDVGGPRGTPHEAAERIRRTADAMDRLAANPAAGGDVEAI